MILLKLFFEFLYVGMFSLGGGYATIPLIQDRIINTHGWITTETFVDMITISNMTPGPLTLNISTFVGLDVAGVIGAIIATVAASLIGVLLTIGIYASYKKANQKAYWDQFLKSLRISSTALIFLAGVSIFQLLLIPQQKLELQIILPFIALLLMVWKFKLDTMKILLISGVLGFFLF